MYLKVIPIKKKEHPSLKPTNRKVCLIIVDIVDITALTTGSINKQPWIICYKNWDFTLELV